MAEVGGPLLGGGGTVRVVGVVANASFLTGVLLRGSLLMAETGINPLLGGGGTVRVVCGIVHASFLAGVLLYGGLFEAGGPGLGGGGLVWIVGLLSFMAG